MTKKTRSLTIVTLPLVLHADLLFRSQEMQSLVGSTQTVAISALHCGGEVVTAAGGMIVHTACLPVTIPLNIATSAVNLVVNVAGGAARIACGGDSSCGESTSSSTPFEGLIHGILNTVPVVVETAGRITQEVGATAFGVLGPMIGVKEDGETASSSSQGHLRRQVSLALYTLS